MKSPSIDDALWISRYKALFARIQNTIIDMPNRRLNNMLLEIHRNNGRLPGAIHRQSYAEVTAAEVASIEAAYIAEFGNDPAGTAD